MSNPEAYAFIVLKLEILCSTHCFSNKVNYIGHTRPSSLELSRQCF